MSHGRYGSIRSELEDCRARLTIVFQQTNMDTVGMFTASPLSQIPNHKDWFGPFAIAFCLVYYLPLLLPSLSTAHAFRRDRKVAYLLLDTFVVVDFASLAFATHVHGARNCRRKQCTWHNKERFLLVVIPKTLLFLLSYVRFRAHVYMRANKICSVLMLYGTTSFHQQLGNQGS
eukprot:scaffold134_cov94-Amphora_coffeaeformis.AAC.18